MKVVGVEGEYLEGCFFFDIYLFISSELDFDLFQCVYDVMVVVFEEEWVNCVFDFFYDFFYEVLIMVFIVECEIGVIYEWVQVVGVFVWCLQKGMCLQIDLIVIYGMGDKYKGCIGKWDLCIYMFYNIYWIDGLLLMLIVLFGWEVIYVVLYLVDGDVLYFVVWGDGIYKFFWILVEYQKVVCEFQFN